VPEKKFFLDFSKAVTIGLMAVIITAFLFGLAGVIIFFAFSKFFNELMTLMGIILVFTGFMIVCLIIAGIIMFLAQIGVVFQYWSKTTEVSGESKGYSLDKAEEAGLRGKGSSQ